MKLKITVNKTILRPQGGQSLLRLLRYDYLCPDQYSQLKTSFYQMKNYKFKLLIIFAPLQGAILI